MGDYLDFQKIKADNFGYMTEDDPFSNAAGGGFFDNLMQAFQGGVSTYAQISAVNRQKKEKAESYVLARIENAVKEVDPNNPASIQEAKTTLEQIGGAKGNWDDMPIVKDVFAQQYNKLKRFHNTQDQYETIMENIYDDSGGKYDPSNFVIGQSSLYQDNELMGDALSQKLDEAEKFFKNQYTELEKIGRGGTFQLQEINEKLDNIQRLRSYVGFGQTITPDEFKKYDAGRYLEKDLQEVQQNVYNKQTRLSQVINEIHGLKELRDNPGAGDIWDNDLDNPTSHSNLLAKYEVEYKLLTTQLPKLNAKYDNLYKEMYGTMDGSSQSMDVLGIGLNSSTSDADSSNDYSVSSFKQGNSNSIRVVDGVNAYDKSYDDVKNELLHYSMVQNNLFINDNDPKTLKLRELHKQFASLDPSEPFWKEDSGHLHPETREPMTTRQLYEYTLARIDTKNSVVKNNNVNNLVDDNKQSTYSNTYKIVGGDSLSEIADSNNVELSQLLAANPEIGDANSIKVGQVINIPSGVDNANNMPSSYDDLETQGQQQARYNNVYQTTLDEQTVNREKEWTETKKHMLSEIFWGGAEMKDSNGIWVADLNNNSVGTLVSPVNHNERLEQFWKFEGHLRGGLGMNDEEIKEMQTLAVRGLYDQFQKKIEAKMNTSQFKADEEAYIKQKVDFIVDGNDKTSGKYEQNLKKEYSQKIGETDYKSQSAKRYAKWTITSDENIAGINFADTDIKFKNEEQKTKFHKKMTQLETLFEKGGIQGHQIGTEGQQFIRDLTMDGMFQRADEQEFIKELQGAGLKPKDIKRILKKVYSFAGQNNSKTTYR